MLTLIQSEDNPLIKKLRKLKQQPTSYRKLGQVWLEGEHLCESYAQLGVKIDSLILAEHATEQWQHSYQHLANKVVQVSSQLWPQISSLDSPAQLGFLINLPAEVSPDINLSTVVLDRLQDAGNVGAILRSAAAFGVEQVLAIKGTAALWSNKVIRAAMGAHFSLRLCEGLTTEQLLELELPLLVTSSHQGEFVHQLTAPPQGAWVFGHEGQGVAVELQQAAQAQLQIYQPGGQESLNVAAAAAICLHASAVAKAN